MYVRTYVCMYVCMYIYIYTLSTFIYIVNKARDLGISTQKKKFFPKLLHFSGCNWKCSRQLEINSHTKSMIMRGDTRLTRLIAPTKLSSVWHQCMDFQLPSALSTTPETAGPTEGRVIQHVGLADRKCWASFLYARCSSPKKAMEALSAAANISVYIYIHIYNNYMYSMYTYICTVYIYIL